MEIICIRHGKPAFRYPPAAQRISGARFNRLLEQYDEAGLAPAWNSERAYLLEGRVISSDLPRALETAALLTKLPVDEIEVDPMFREVPLPRFRREKSRLPAFMFMPLSRLGWFTGWMASPEDRGASRARVKAAADRLEQMARESSRVLLFSHGFFLWLLGGELRVRGWTTTKRGPYRYLERAEFLRT